MIQARKKRFVRSAYWPGQSSDGLSATARRATAPTINQRAERLETAGRKLRVASPGLGVAHQAVDQFGRAVVIVAAAGQFNRGREAFAEVGIFFLDDGGEGVMVEPTAERGQQPKDEHNQAKTGPDAEDADAHRRRKIKEEIGEQGGAEAERENERQQAQPAEETHPTDAMGDGGDPITEARRQGNGSGHDANSPWRESRPHGRRTAEGRQ